MNGGTGSYETVRGDHVHQVASRTSKPGAKRETAPQFKEALSVSTKNPSYADKAGQKVEGAINRAAWGRDYNGKPAGSSGKVTLQSTGNTAVGNPQSANPSNVFENSATPSNWFEDTKSYYKLLEAGKTPDEAARLVLKSGDQLAKAGANPQRVPNAPRSLPDASKAGQVLSSETPTTRGEITGVRNSSPRNAATASASPPSAPTPGGPPNSVHMTPLDADVDRATGKVVPGPNTDAALKRRAQFGQKGAAEAVTAQKGLAPKAPAPELPKTASLSQAAQTEQAATTVGHGFKAESTSSQAAKLEQAGAAKAESTAAKVLGGAGTVVHGVGIYATGFLRNGYSVTHLPLPFSRHASAHPGR